ncbi:protein PET100 homolog, mitochondrial-like isoform X2 [Amphiura filiformis]|uniref:protein PET100 homolog, mitochondrial-like isoform X1 n=1 Tax=Amphiura filiformis TaxID=82378 RepID=UPI003B216C5B
MGDWKLEVFRMSFYVFFPLSIFYLCNQTDYFKDGKAMSWLYEVGDNRQGTPEQIAERKREHREFLEKRWQEFEAKRKVKEEAELKLLEEKRQAFNSSSSS